MAVTWVLEDERSLGRQHSLRGKEPPTHNNDSVLVWIPKYPRFQPAEAQAYRSGHTRSFAKSGAASDRRALPYQPFVDYLAGH